MKQISPAFRASRPTSISTIRPGGRGLPQVRGAWRASIGRTRSHSLTLSKSLPLIFFQVYLTGSVLVFAMGPIDFSVHNPWTLYTYVLVGQLSVFLGYHAGTHRPTGGYSQVLSIPLAMKIVILCTLVMLPLTLRYRNFGSLTVAEALTDPGAAYSARLETFSGSAQARWLSILRGVLGPALSVFVPLGVVYWNRISSSWKTMWSMGLVGVIATSLLSGAAIGIFDIVLVTPWMLYLHFQHRQRNAASAHIPQRRSGHGRIRAAKASPWWNKAFAAVLAFAVLGAGVQYFSYSRQSRYGMQGDEYPEFTTGWSRPMYGISLPASIEYPVYMITNYWTQGYQGLSECLELPFVGCWGAGHSSFWMRYAGQLTSDPDWFLENCYPMRLQSVTGYSAEHNWHTIYPWLASDLTFPGAIVFLGLLAYLLAGAWNDALDGRNPFAVGFVAQILILFYYVPANNGRLSYPEETLAFWGLLAMWQATCLRRSRFDRRHVRTAVLCPPTPSP